MSNNTFCVDNLPEWTHDLYENLPPMSGYRDISRVCGMAWGSIANLVSEGKGPQDGVILGRKRVFPRAAVVTWLATMASQNEERYSSRTKRA